MTIFDYRLPNDRPCRLVWPLLLMLLFLALGFSVKHTHFFDVLNRSTLIFLMAHHSYHTDIFFIGATLLCEAPYHYTWGVALLIWLLLYRHWAVIIYFAVVLESAAKLSPFFKHLFNIPRPSDTVVNIGYAYPSGHTLLACMAFGFLSLVLTQHLKARQKYWALLAYNLPAILVGISRLYLGVHWLTDVIGGALLAWAVNLFVYFIYTRYSTYPVKPNKVLLILVGISMAIFCYLVNLHLEEQLYFYRYIFNHLMT